MSGPNENDDERQSGEPLSRSAPPPPPQSAPRPPPPPPPPPPPQSQPGHQEPARLRFDGVVLAGSIEQGQPTAQDLTVLIDDQGVDIVSRQPPANGVCRGRPSPTSGAAHGVDTSGRITTPLDITSANRTVRFYLYGDRVDEPRLVELRSRLPIWTRPSW